MKKKKLIISLCVVLGVIVALVIFMFTLFSLKSVEVDFRFDTSAVAKAYGDDTNYDETEIIDSGKISLGGTVFFKSKKAYAKNIENAYPNLNVVNIETVFPNKFVIHIAYRTPMFYVCSGESFYVLDSELKVLSIQTNVPSCICLDISYENETISVCDFLDTQENVFCIYSAYVAYVENSNAESMFLSNFSTLKICDGNAYLLKTEGGSFEILGYRNYTRAKMEAVLQTYSAIFSSLEEQDGQMGKEITYQKATEQDGEKATEMVTEFLTSSQIENASFVVGYLQGYENKIYVYIKN